ncbi:hypothetical protein [Silvimonas iriomotensis]|uniref:hypothetical protein n=1 Tax=Silvimonas iriomotensis TaxID=449662 RepID=UPI00166DEDDB|nr:hypothetical protein [Silvimonas iriomotensis]
MNKATSAKSDIQKCMFFDERRKFENQRRIFTGLPFVTTLFQAYVRLIEISDKTTCRLDGISGYLQMN